MSNALFPTLIGLTWDIKLVPTFSTIVQPSAARNETRIQLDPHPLYQFELNYEFLRDDRHSALRTSSNLAGYTELEQLVGFFNARGGCFDSFLLDPSLLTAKPDAGLAQGVTLGTADGATRDFQLLWNYGGFLDEVQAPNGTPTIYANGVAVTGWTLNPLGIIHFASAPAAGAVISADCRWRWRVRFADDSQNFKSFMFNLYECQGLKLMQVRDE